MRFLGVPVGAMAAIALLASSGLQNTSPSQWSTGDVYEILHKSPWSKTVKVGHSERGLINDSGPAAGSIPSTTGSAGPMSGRMGGMGGGMGRRGAGGGSYGGSRASGGNGGSRSPVSSSAQVLIQWQSALPVRLAAAKEAGQNPTAVSSQPANDYVIGVVGLPLADVGGHAASLGSGTTTDAQETQFLEQRLQNAAALLVSGHNPLAPSSVALDQGKDGRIVFHFPKTDPITPKDKTVVFRIATEGTKIQKKFVLKEMEYQGRLEL